MYNAYLILLLYRIRMSSIMLRKVLIIFILILFPWISEAKLPDITPEQTTKIINEIMKSHATHKILTPVLIKRVLTTYLEELDPTKSYLMEPDIHQWLEPSDAMVEKMITGYKNADFSTFGQIQDVMAQAIQRRHKLEAQIDIKNLPKKVRSEEFKNMQWTHNEKELLDRITRIKALQIEAAAKLNEDLRPKALQRIHKRQQKTEEDILNQDLHFRERFILSNVIKATASALDTHTAYFTPEEATQFMINVQQRLFGIGAQLRDDINGFTVIKIIEGSPAHRYKQLKVKDRIIAVNGEPVVGMDIADAVELIRGEENTPVTLTVIREIGDVEPKSEEKIDITIPRGEVVLQESRYESSIEPFGDGVIAYLRLHSFYQDPESSSAEDLTKAFEKIAKENKVTGVVLDLRFNAGGLLSQAVNVAGLFITKGIVATIVDENENIQHLRDLDGTAIWNGPLIVLINRASASASEIVAQALQDYGRAIIVGDDHSYGKGTFQTFTLNTTKNTSVNPRGEYKVTRGRYYTVSGKSPQLTGVGSDIIVPGILSEMDIGEKFSKYPIENDKIKENFNDDLSDVPFFQREKVKSLYKFNLQTRLTTYKPYVDTLKKNSEERIKNNKNYQNFLKEIKKKELADDENQEQFGQSDLQLYETYNIMKDLIYLTNHK